MNFHYQGPKQHLIEELHKIDREIEQDKQKLAQQVRLEAEVHFQNITKFYEDAQNQQQKPKQPIDLADQVMNQLLMKKPIDKQRVQSAYEPIPQRKPVQLEKPPILQNNLINQRQIEKMKLQQQNSHVAYPFGNSREKDRQRVEHSPKNKSYENLAQKYDRSISSYVPSRDRDTMNKRKPPSPKIQKNPFIAHEDFIKAKREEDEKRYRKLLEEQVEQKRKQKEQEKRQLKLIEEREAMIYGQLPKRQVDIDYQQVQQPPKSPINKKRDPNGKFPEYKMENNISSSDIQYMKMQVQQLKTKRRRGRINHEQYEKQIQKIERFYKKNVQQLQNSPKPQKQLDFQEDQIRYPEEAQENKPISHREKVEELQSIQPDEYVRKSNIHGAYEQPKPQQYYDPRYMNPSSNMIHSLQPQNPSHHSQQGSMHQTNEIQMQMMMMKLFDELKELRQMYKTNLISDKKLMQETFSRMNMNQYPFMNPQMLTQQVPPSQMPPPQKEFFTDGKKHEERQKQKILPSEYSHSQGNPHMMESDNSVSYIDKSLSGIVNRIPLTQKQREEEKHEEKQLNRFYNRKYKVKEFKSFGYKQDVNRSNKELPSISNFLQAKNSHHEVKRLFEKDLHKYKAMQRKKEMERMREMVQSNSKYSEESSLKCEPKHFMNRQLEEPGKKVEEKLSQENSFLANPFLKKHISSMENQVPTFKENDFEHYSIPKSPEQSNILEQEQYQTEPRKSSSPKHSPKRVPKVQFKEQIVEEKREIQIKSKPQASTKILNVIKTNNQLLSKYEKSPSEEQSIKESLKIEQQSQQYESKPYFDGQFISPVQRKEYQSSLETVRSEEESIKIERKNNADLFLFGSEQKPQLIYSPKQIIIENEEKPAIVETEKAQNQPQIQQIGYSQTVESFQQNSIQLKSYQKPPFQKKGRSVGRKKESVIRMNNQSIQRSALISQLHEKSVSQHQIRKINTGESELCESVFENTIGNESPKIECLREFQQKELSRNSKMKDHLFSEESSANSNSLPPIKEEQVKAQPGKKEQATHEQPVEKVEKKQMFAPKLKSLDQARKLAKQYKLRSTEEQNKSSVEQKLSQLQSFIHLSRKDDSFISIKQPKQATKKKKDIMKILNELGNDEEYQPDFDSYQQESER